MQLRRRTNKKDYACPDHEQLRVSGYKGSH